MSVTEESVPSVVDKVTASPPEVTLFPNISLSRTVITLELDPSATILSEDAEITDADASAAPGRNVTDSVSVNIDEFTVAVIVDDPATVGAVNVTV